MRALAIDTVTEMCSVALYDNGALLARNAMSVNQHSNIVLDMVDAVLAESGISLSQLDLLISDVGPGSFTGIRIGMGVSCGLAYAADLPMLGVDSLSSLAQALIDEDKIKDKQQGQDAPILAAIDARMSQVYWALFETSKGKTVAEPQSRTQSRTQPRPRLHLSDPARCAEIEPKVQSSRLRGIGSGWDTYAEILQKQGKDAEIKLQRYPLAVNGLAIALEMPKESWQSAGELSPIYLRNDVAKVSQKSLLNK